MRHINGSPTTEAFGFHINRTGKLSVLTRPRVHGRPHLRSAIFGGVVYRADGGWTHDLTNVDTYATQEQAGGALYRLLTTARVAADRS